MTKNAISDAQLLDAVRSLEVLERSTKLPNGFANYGGGVYKIRLAREKNGKSRGYRAIILFCQGDKCFGIYGFAKNERDNITLDEKKFYKSLSKKLLGYSSSQIDELLKAGEYYEVIDA